VATRKRTTTTAAEPEVLVEWVRAMDDATGGGNIGDRHYRGQAGERAEMPEGAAQVLEGAGFVRRVVMSQLMTSRRGARQRSGATAPGTGPATPQDAPAAGFTNPAASSEQAASPAP